jgi:hypothetical protein
MRLHALDGMLSHAVQGMKPHHAGKLWQRISRFPY